MSPNWRVLKDVARIGAKQRGHKMGRFQKLSHCLWFAHCERCTAYLRVGGDPQVSGDALQLACLCHVCRVRLDQEDKPETQDCGGDCLKCMAEVAEDPGAIAAMKEIKRREK